MDLTIDQLQQRLRDMHARIGFEGRFALTIDQMPQPKCYITHWVKPGEWAFEKCKAVGVGSIDDCLDALEHYVADYRPQAAQAQTAA